MAEGQPYSDTKFTTAADVATLFSAGFSAAADGDKLSITDHKVTLTYKEGLKRYPITVYHTMFSTHGPRAREALVIQGAGIDTALIEFRPAGVRAFTIEREVEDSGRSPSEITQIIQKAKPPLKTRLRRAAARLGLA